MPLDILYLLVMTSSSCHYSYRIPSYALVIFAMQEDGEVAKLFTPYDFFMFASTQMRELQRDFVSRKGVGIYKREFHFIPNHGREAVNRRIPKCNRLGDVGIKKLHFFESIGRPGFVGVRERSCHRCASCAEGKFADCKDADRCGHYRILELSPKTAATRASTRRQRENGAMEFSERAREGQFFACDRVFVTTDKFRLFAVAQDSLFREAEESLVANESTGQMQVTAGEFVLDAMSYSCVSAGGTVFTPTGVEIVVPVLAIVAFDLDMEKLEARRVFRASVGNIEKWQLSSDDHARILQLLSESLDDAVSRAVENVSGRS